jgi:phage terminase large subunit-like protein
MDKGRRSRGNHEDNYTDAEDKKVIWNNTAIQVLRQGKFKEPTVYALSVGSKVTGQHYDLAILDDIVDFDNTATVAKMDKTFEWAQDLESVLDPLHICEYTGEPIGDEVIINGTRYAAGDYYEAVLNDAKELGYETFIRNIYVNGIDNADGYIWFEKFNDDTVQKLKRRLTSRRWASQYLNSILLDGEAILAIDNIQYIPSANIHVDKGTAYIKQGQEEIPVRLYMVVDPAVSQSKTADNTSIAVGGQDDQGNLYIVDGVAGKLTPQKIVDEVFRLADKWQLSGVFIEMVGWQGALEHYIREKFATYRPLAIYPWNPQGKGKKKERIEFYLQPVFNQRMIFVPPWMKQWDILTNELLAFGSPTGHDDILDTWAMIKEISKPILRTRRRKRAFATRTYNGQWGGMRA